jgi:SAM-dependent methyltransferase
MNVNHETVVDQTTLWNGPSGHIWVEAQEALDKMFQPFEDLLVDAVAAKSPGAVLDVGCGTGSTTLAVARRLGTEHRCIGIDISQPMIAAARGRAEHEHSPARFICADAQVHAFDRGTFGAIMSRFGVMFFDDSVRAFANLRHAASDNAEIRFVAWRSAAETSFMTTAERAAAPLLPNLQARRPDGPGQFAFADAERVQRILAESGWTEIDISPIDVGCTVPQNELAGFALRLGPLGRILQDTDDRTRAGVAETVRAAFASYVHGDDVRFTASCWMVTARARSQR